MSTGKLRHRDSRHDSYYQRAKKEHFAGRAVYKLQELDQRYHLLKPGHRVLDLGCWPGSWLQYAASVVGNSGALVGADRFALEIAIPGPGLRQEVGDVFEMTPERLRGELAGFDVVLSDMAPDTTGVRMTDQARSEGLFAQALELATAVLVPGGHFVGKLFQGPEWNSLLLHCRRQFTVVRTVKPESSRRESIEQYVVATGFRGR